MLSAACCGARGWDPRAENNHTTSNAIAPSAMARVKISDLNGGLLLADKLLRLLWL